MLEQLPLADIRAFVMTAEAGSFTRAALTPGVSRSQVSKQLLSMGRNGIRGYLKSLKFKRGSAQQQCSRLMAAQSVVGALRPWRPAYAATLGDSQPISSSASIR